MCGACVVPGGPGTGAGLDGGEPELAVAIGGHAPVAAERRLQRLVLRSSGWAYRPCALACQSSSTASGTGFPSPSSTRPRTVTRSPAHARRGQLVARVSQLEADREEGPDGLRRRRLRGSAPASKGVASRPAQDDVEPVAERVLGHRRLPVEGGDQARRARSSAVQLKIGSAPSSGSPGKYIWVTRRVAKAGPKTEKWMCAGRQALCVVPPGIGAGPDGDEAIAALVVGQERGRSP